MFQPFRRGIRTAALMSDLGWFTKTLMQNGKNNPPPPTHGARPNSEIEARLEAAVLKVFSYEDFHKADMRTIAKTAGVSFETIYKYYGSKEKLLFAFVGAWLDKLTEEAVRNIQGVEDLKEKIRLLVWTQLDYYERNPDMAKILYLTVPYSAWMADGSFGQTRLPGVVLDAIREGQRKGLLNPGVRASLLLDVMYGIVRRCFIMWIYRGRTESLTSQADSIFEVIWGGISKPVSGD